MVCKARREALNSTGKVSSWNSATKAYNTIPTIISGRQVNTMPSSTSGIPKEEPMRVAGMAALRIFSGA